MESWILHYDPHYDALPWPFDRPWSEVVRSDLPLPHACEDFGRLSPTDGSTETPAVPPRLPRAVPAGRYRMGVYHDPDWLYVLLDATPGPAVLTPAMIETQVQVPRNCASMAVLNLLSADGRFVFAFFRDREGALQGRAQSARHGPRRSEPPARTPEWEFAEHPRPDGERTGWRLRRADLAGILDGSRLRLGISRLDFRSLEFVAWGGGFAFAPRPDEMGKIRLADRHEPAPCPVCRRLELHYDPFRETGRFRMFWTDLYQAGETITDRAQPHRGEVPIRACGFQLNGLEERLDLAPEVETGEIAIPDGHNAVAAVTIGEMATRVFFEKRSGNRIADCPFPAVPDMTRPELLARLRAETAAAHAAYTARRARGEPFDLIRWPLYQAASAGRVHAWLDPDPRLLDILRGVADEALALQRPDGTFGGYHMGRLRPAGAGEAPRWSGGAYDSGQAGELWAVAAALLGEDKYLDASRRLVRAYEQYRIEFNHNFAAFALFHLATHYRLTREPLALEHGLYYARHLVAVNILPLGFQAGHNFYSVYGGITLRGMANLCQVLPEQEPYRAVLREQCLRMANQLLTRLQSDGTFASRDRYFVGERLWVSGLFSVAPLLEPDNLRRLDPTLQILLRAPPAILRFALLESEVARYAVSRDRLLRGEPADQPLAI
jgi:hypothetical protein